MNESLHMLLDEREILTQLHNFCRAMDRFDSDLGRSVFHADALVDYGVMFRGRAHEMLESAIDSHHALQNQPWDPRSAAAHRR